MNYEKVTCSNCKHNQEIQDSNIYQDIGGKWVICEKCNNNFYVEPKEID